MAVDVFNDDNGCIDQEPQTQQKGEQGDPVDRLPGDVGDEEGDRENRRDGEGDDQRFTPSQDIV